MTLRLHRYFLINTFTGLFLLLSSLGSTAQCPQRYLDKVFEEVRPRYDIMYGGHKLNTDGTRSYLAFDIYQPEGDTAQLRPLVVLIHGGGFMNFPPLFSTTPDIVELAKDLAKRGYVVISPEYRLFSGDPTYQKMAETAMAAALDIHTLMCFLSNTISDGNPYRIDSSKFFLGGSSAGALLSLNFGAFINDTSELRSDYRVYMNNVAALDNVNPQEILQHKFCGMQPKAIIAISGALLDTAIIKPTSVPFYIVHGKLDGAINYQQGHVFNDPSLPLLYGPGKFIPLFERAGIRVEADIYPDAYHVPVLLPFGDNLLYAIQQLLLTGTPMIEPVLDSTQRHLARFLYTALGSPVSNCTLTGIGGNIVTRQLAVFPNPSDGIYTVELPSSLQNKSFLLGVYDVTGKAVVADLVRNRTTYSFDLTNQAKGVYWLTIRDQSDREETIYISKLVLQ